MRAISLWQPWGSAMTVRRPNSQRMLKNIETRGWAPSADAVGQRMAICAAKTQKDTDTKEPLRDWWMARVKRDPFFRACFEARGFTDWETLPFGAVIAHGLLVAVLPTEQLAPRLDRYELAWGNYGPERFGWVFENIQVLATPVPIVGKQGIFMVDDALLEVAA